MLPCTTVVIFPVICLTGIIMSMTKKFKKTGGVFLLGDIRKITGKNPEQRDLGVPFANSRRDKMVSTHPLPILLTL